MKQFTSKTQRVGEFGEKICAIYLRKTGFKIIETNYTKTFGEIDIIATKDNILHFIEVKSIRTKTDSRETYNPAENLTKKKYLKIYKTIVAYLEDFDVSHETNWQIDLYSIFIDEIDKKHRVSKIENVVIS
ncbi:MAG: YraN family protein [Candidatus Pacebacteria bacterium]|nr:YraN family protein [Candidatus Paceibacterota bacterium]